MVAAMDLAVDLSTMSRMMDHVADTVFFVKDLERHYVTGNRAMAQFCGLNEAEDLPGRSTAEFFPRDIIARYDELDAQVIGEGCVLNDRLDLTVDKDGRPAWYLYSRLPVEDRKGRRVAAMGVSRRLPMSKARNSVYERLCQVSEHIVVNYAERLEIHRLADLAGVSKSQLERDFLRLFGVTPSQYQARIRMDHARVLLAGGESIAVIAQTCGYEDQSAFSRRFRAMFGKSPTQMRRERVQP